MYNPACIKDSLFIMRMCVLHNNYTLNFIKVRVYFQVCLAINIAEKT